jgi:hypothetical protein
VIDEQINEKVIPPVVEKNKPEQSLPKETEHKKVIESPVVEKPWLINPR